MTLLAPTRQKVVCDSCGDETASDSGGAPKGWYIITAGPGCEDRYDFCGWPCVARYFRAVDETTHAADDGGDNA